MAAVSDPEVRAFLRRARVARVASRSSTGRPFMTPLWFVVDGGTLVLATSAGSWTARNAARHPEVALLFGGESAGDRFLRVRGTASVRPGMPPWRVLLRFGLKYYLSPEALRVELGHVRRWGLRRRYHAQARGGPAHLRIAPVSAEFLPPPG